MADPKRSLDSEQISPATIAHHTVYEKTPNLHQSHICQWVGQPYLVGPLSRLVGKPPLSPWLSRNILPLTQAGNGPNSAISLTEIFDRIFLDVCNSLGFRVSKSKKRGSGNSRVYRSLKQHSDLGACYTLNFSAAGCECIHLTRVHVHYCTGVLLIFAHGTDTDGRVMVQNR